MCNFVIRQIVASLTDLQAAEKLYTKGFISYPRTETDQFDKAIDLKKLIEKQQPDNNWGGYAQGYVPLNHLLSRN